MATIGVGIIGSGKIALANHLPGIGLCKQARVTALCDSDAKTLAAASASSGVSATTRDYRELLARDDVQAVIISTPNFLHAEIALAAIAAGKHVLCEKPIAMDLSQAMAMWRAAEKAGVRNMAAFTYRFVPAMRYMHHLARRGDIGRPYHFRANRLQDWGDRPLGWRQERKFAGTGELGDMLSHRIDYGLFLIGPLDSLVADTRTFVPVRQGHATDVDDWVAILGRFKAAAGAAMPTGVWESSKLTTGRGEDRQGQDYCEINGDAGSIVFNLSEPLALRIGKLGDTALRTVPVPREFLVWPGSPRDPNQGDPLTVFRYDQDVEFIQAILEGRPCTPSFRDGAAVEAVMDATVESAKTGRWVKVEAPE